MAYGATPTGFAVEVFVFRDGRYLGSTLVSRSQFVIGSGPDADVVLQSSSVAPRHVTITVQDGKLILTDMGTSAEGVLVNGHQIENVYVGSTDEVTVGRYQLKVSLHEPQKRAPVFEGSMLIDMGGAPGQGGGGQLRQGSTVPMGLGVIPEPSDQDNEPTVLYKQPIPAEGAAAPPTVRPTGKTEVAEENPFDGVEDEATTVDKPWQAPGESRATDPWAAAPAAPAAPTESPYAPSPYQEPVAPPASVPPALQDRQQATTIPEIPSAQPSAQYPWVNPTFDASKGGLAASTFPSPLAPSPGPAPIDEDSTSVKTMPRVMPELEPPMADPVIEDAFETAAPPPPPAASRAPDYFPPPQQETAPVSVGSQELDFLPTTEQQIAQVSAELFPPVHKVDRDSAIQSLQALQAAAAKPSLAPTYVDPADFVLDAEEQEEARFEAEWQDPYNLASVLLADSGESSIDSIQQATLTVLHTRGAEVVQLHRADGPDKLRVGSRRRRLVRSGKEGGGTLFFHEDWKGVVCRGGSESPISLVEGQRAGRGMKSVRLSIGDWARVELPSGDCYHVRALRPPRIPTLEYRNPFSRVSAYVIGGSALLHLLVLIAFNIYFLKKDARVVSDKERFASVAMEELTLELPDEEEPEPEPEPETPDTEPEPVMPEPSVAIAKKPAKKPKRSSAATDPDSTVVEKPSKAIGALEALRTSAGGREDIRKAVTSLSLVKGPAGSPAAFKTSAAMEKLPGGRLVMTGGSGKGAGVDVRTRTGAELIGGEKGRATVLKGKARKRAVSGLVVKAPAAKAKMSGGIMDRAAILKVVNKNMAQIRRCYQKALLGGTSAEGKVVFEWTIKLNGVVGTARVKVSSLKNPMVESCIIKSIKSWKFPSPKGGNVIVSFPFVFSAAAF